MGLALLAFGCSLISAKGPHCVWYGQECGKTDRNVTRVCASNRTAKPIDDKIAEDVLRRRCPHLFENGGSYIHHIYPDVQFREIRSFPSLESFPVRARPQASNRRRKRSTPRSRRSRLGNNNFQFLIRESLSAISAEPPKTCCDAGQIGEMNEGMRMAESIFGRCATCVKNMFRLICDITCGPEQSRYMKVTKKTKEGNSTKEYVNEIEVRSQ